MSKYSKAPWIVEDEPYDSQLQIFDGDSNTIATVDCPQGYEAEAKANACIMAQSIDMLHVIRTPKDCLPELDDDETPLQGSEAVAILCNVWPEISRILECVEAANVTV